MRIKSGKSVQKIVNKSAQKSWIKNVQKIQYFSYTQFFKKSTIILQSYFDSFYTKITVYINLLYLSFTRFSHRTTITTTY